MMRTAALLLLALVLLPGHAAQEQPEEPEAINAESVIEAVEYTSRHLGAELRAEIVELENPDAMIRYHHGLGTWVRNHCGLWREDSGVIAALERASLSFGGHPDEASHIVLGALWAYERGRAAAQAAADEAARE